MNQAYYNLGWSSPNTYTGNPHMRNWCEKVVKKSAITANHVAGGATNVTIVGGLHKGPSDPRPHLRVEYQYVNGTAVEHVVP
ncbi:hypothetical protein FRC08_007202 [Ceratobasidium sp. 394]|nr:hypothetical protein FRC08_007202 [Ceratobasidium sp. 394]